jgi:hypothetical protein
MNRIQTINLDNAVRKSIATAGNARARMLAAWDHPVILADLRAGQLLKANFDVAAAAASLSDQDIGGLTRYLQDAGFPITDWV